MADITINCPSCGNSVTISEFVSAEFLVCFKCKGQIPVPARQQASNTVEKLRLGGPKAQAPQKTESEVEPPTAGELHSGDRRYSVTQNFFPDARKRVKRRKTNVFALRVMPWLIFVVLGAVFAWVRYSPGVLPKHQLDLVIQGGVWALVFLHLTVVAYAFSDEAFQGVLCLIIPGYSLYYLFVQSDQFMLRAVVAALMVGFGWDTAVATGKLWREFYVTANAFLADPDSIKKR